MLMVEPANRPRTRIAMPNLNDFSRLIGLDHGLVVLSTSRANGTVQSSVGNAGVLDHPAGDHQVVGFVSAGSAKRLANLRARPHATVVARAGWEWVGVEGSVQLVGPDDPVNGIDAEQLSHLLRNIFTAAGGSHDDWDEYDRVMAAERRVAILIQPARIFGPG